jgi:hypothetical protein
LGDEASFLPLGLLLRLLRGLELDWLFWRSVGAGDAEKTFLGVCGALWWRCCDEAA